MHTLRRILLLLACWSSACSSNVVSDQTPPSQDEPTSPDPTPTDQTTWYQDVAPIMYEKCVGCHHSPGGIAPFSLEDFDSAAPIASLLLEAVETGAMPPWSARDASDCTPEHNWKNDARVSDAQIEVLQDWVADGAPLGDIATAAALPPSIRQELEGATHDLAMPPYTTSGFEDELRCFVLDPQITATRYMTGVEVIPSNLEVSHHAIVSVVPPSGAQAVRDLGDNGFRCTGVLSVPGAYVLDVWVPGAVPFETPENSGTAIEPGSLLVLQMHYHPTGFAHEPDQTHIKLRLEEEKPEKSFVISLLGNASAAPILQPGPNDNGDPRFFIPANVGSHTETMDFVLNLPNSENTRFPVVSVIPHMHYVGQNMQIKVHRANPLLTEPVDECLVNITNWDFDWQRTYIYDAEVNKLPMVRHGDTVSLKCEYNNTLENRFVQRMLQEEGLVNPVDVLLGDNTTDEMCVAIFGVVF